MRHLEQLARQRGIPRLRLETGVRQPAAISLYRQLGYQEIAPFGDYVQHPLSVFFEKTVGSAV